MNKNLIVRIVIGIVVVGLVGLALWRGIGRSPAASPTPEPTGSPLSVPASPLTYDAPGADWQTYASASMGISVRYPKDWVTAPCGPDCVAFALASDSETFIAGIGITDGKLADLVSQSAPYTAASASAEINGTQWLHLTLVEPQTNAVFTWHFTEHGGRLYQVGTDATDRAILDDYASIIASLKFTK